MSSVDLVEVFVDPSGPEIIEVMSPGPPGVQGPAGATGATGAGFTSIANGTLLGNDSGSAALPSALNAAAVRSLLAMATTNEVVFSGLSFSGTGSAGLRVKSLTSAEYNALTPANGDLFRDSTTDRIDARLARGTVELVDTAGGQTINGALTTTGQIRSSANGAASTPATYLTGTWFSGGTGITTKPQLLIEPTGTTSTAWNTNGSAIGVNAASGFLGNLVDAKVNNSTLFSVNYQGVVSGSGFTCASGWVYATVGNAFYDSSGTLQRFRIGGTTYFTIATTGVDVVGGINASGTVTASGTGVHTFGTGASDVVTMQAGLLYARVIGGTVSSGIQNRISLYGGASDGNCYLTDWSTAATFGRLGLGPLTSAFPALKRSGTTVAFRLGDDSADAPITCSNLTASGTVRLGTFTVGTLPSAAANTRALAYVTDSTVASFGAVATAGGALGVTVFSNGTNWIVSGGTTQPQKAITSGTAAPSGGVDGDIYLQYV